MKKYALCYNMLLLLPVLGISQPAQDIKRDYFWVAGYSDYEKNPNLLDFITYNFNNIPTKIINTPRPTGYRILVSNTSICDLNGNLVLYTNGCAIIQADHKPVMGAEQINKGQAANSTCKFRNGYNTARSLFLPDYQEKEGFTLFHIVYNYFPALQTQLRYSRVVPNAQTEWVAAFTDSLIMPNEQVDIKQSACRHANGRDWWIVNPLRFEPKAITLLYTKGEIKQQWIQTLDTLPVNFNYGGADFTPDGRKYIFYELSTGVRIYDFDRCTGKISNPKYVKDNVSFDSTQIGEMVISPNSRFLYLNRGYNVLQYDLEASNIAASRTEITSFVTDSITRDSGLAVGFYAGRLGPDGKIYICGPNGTRYIYIIEKPNEKGRACNLHPYKLPAYNSADMPYYPNFRLGALKGSSCDTLTTPTQEINQIGQLKIYPNPATDLLKIDMTLDDYGALEKCQLRVVDIVGKVHQTHPLSNFASIKEISVANLANGLYFVQLVDKQGFLIANSKVVVAR